MIAEVRHPQFGTIRMPGFPINSAQANAQPSRSAPVCGQDTRDVLLAAGYSNAEIDALQAWGAIHCTESGAQAIRRAEAVAP